MSRIRTLFTTIIPALAAGGLLFGTASGHASAGDGPPGFLPVAADTGGTDDDADADDARRAPGKRTADAPRRHRTPPTPPAPPEPPDPPEPPAGWDHSRPLPPLPPAPPHLQGRKGGPGRISISVRNGKVQIDGLEGFTRHQLDAVGQLIRNNPDIPKEARDKVLARLDRARTIVDKRLKNLSTTDLDKIGDEMEKMGDELEKAMEGLEEEMGKLGDKLGKDLARKLGKDFAKSFKPGKIQINPGDDNDAHDDDDGDDDAHAVVVMPDADADGDAHDAIQDLKDLTLKPDQRDRIAKLHATSEQEISRARKQLDDASKRLEIALADAKTSDADISRYIDQVSMHEAAIRKARLLAWVNARRLLDDAQRKKIEDAARKNHK